MSGEPSALTIDTILEMKRQQVKLREVRSPLAATLSLAAMQPAPHNILGYVDDDLMLIGQVTHTAPMYDPVAAALDMVYEGADAIAFFTDHGVYNQDLEDMFLVTRGCQEIPVIYQNYIMNAYHVVAARVANASAIVFHMGVGDPAILRAAITTAQRLKLTVFLTVISPDQLAEASSLSPHVICYGGMLADDVAASLRQLPLVRQRVPHHIKLMLGHTLRTLHEVEQAMQVGVRALILDPGLLHGDNARQLRAWVGK